MKTIKLTTMADCVDVLEGGLWMGTGGGGSYNDGMALFKGALESGLSLEWVDVESIPDDVWTATIGLHGTIAPMSRETQSEIDRMGLIDIMGDMYLVEAVKELGEYMGHEFGCLVPAELGAEAIPEAVVCAARLGIPVVDGDYVGRAVPEEMQSTYCLYGKHSNLFASVDKWGNVVIVKNAINTQALERTAKMLAVAAFGYTAVATTTSKSSGFEKDTRPGDIDQMSKNRSGSPARRQSGNDPINAVLEVVNGWQLFEGTVVGVETDDRDGYLFGTTHIEGRGDFLGQTLDVWFKNENLVSWLNGIHWICSPDLLTLVHKESGRGTYNGDIKKGDEVVAIGMKGLDGFRSEIGLNLAGPRHFGFDIEYTPIEDLI